MRDPPLKLLYAVLNKMYTSILGSFCLTKISTVGLFVIGNTYTHSAGKSPDKPVLSHKPLHHPEFLIDSPVSFPCRMMRSFFLNERKLVFSPKQVTQYRLK